MPQAEIEEQFSLKWNDYQSNLTTGFQHLLEEEIMLDVSLSAGGQLIQAHKIILSICSPYFKNVFQSNPCKHPVIILKDVGTEELLDILEFMYRGEASVKKENLAAFLRLAETLKVRGLAEGNDCEKELPYKKKNKSSDSSNSDMQQDMEESTAYHSPKKRKKRVLHLAKYIEMSQKKRKLMKVKPKVNGEKIKDVSLDKPDCIDKEINNDFANTKNMDNDNDFDDFGGDITDDFPPGPSNSDDNTEHIPSDLRQMLLNAKHVEFIRREDCSMGTTSKGGRKLTCRSYEYNLNLCKLKNNMQTLYWKCSKYVKTKCYARIIMLPNGITKLTGYHNHHPTA